MSRGMLTMLATALAASAALVAGCSQSKTSGWNNGNSTFAQSGKTMFLFFPQAAVYYQPDQKTWYWYTDDCWFKTNTVPSVITQNNFRPTIVELDAPTPFEQQAVAFGGYQPDTTDGPQQTAVTTQHQTFTTATGQNNTQQQGAFATGQSDRPNN
jgi:hypothetical protein